MSQSHTGHCWHHPLYHVVRRSTVYALGPLAARSNPRTVRVLTCSHAHRVRANVFWTRLRHSQIQCVLLLSLSRVINDNGGTRDTFMIVTRAFDVHNSSWAGHLFLGPGINHPFGIVTLSLSTDHLVFIIWITLIKSTIILDTGAQWAVIAANLRPFLTGAIWKGVRIDEAKIKHKIQTSTGW